MSNLTFKCCLLTAAGLTALSAAVPAIAQEDPSGVAGVADQIVIVGEATSYNNSVVTEGMFEQQTPITSPLALIDNLPGVSVQEGDTFGFDDWSTTISIRGFNSSLDRQEIGITIDGMPNGGSNYGGGSKANRYIDNQNIGGIAVSQGTADIASRSNDALGGTLDFMTDNPLNERRGRFSFSKGQFDAERYYGRFDTGLILNDTTKAWISLSHTEASDWHAQSAQNRRDHIAAKFESDFGMFDLTGYFAYDDAHEDNYQRLFSQADFDSNPDWDRLTSEWTGLPGVDQLYRRGWSTLRENLFTYVKADAELFEGLNVSGGVYFHKNYGRGDWVPGSIANVTDDGAGNPESELTSTSPVLGGSNNGSFSYVDGNGVVVAPLAGCTTVVGVAWARQLAPSCYPVGSRPVGSYRHTHYEKDRLGFIADFDYTADFGGFINTLRGGVWYEDGTRDEHRDWHRVTDSSSSAEFDATPYWIQYDRSYPQSTFKWYLEDTVEVGPIAATFGLKQFVNDVDREDHFTGIDQDNDTQTSDVLLSGGLVYEAPIEGLSLFAGYAENYKALSDQLLERDGVVFDELDAETSRNIDAGVRFANDFMQASITYYDIQFDNRVILLSSQTVDGVDFFTELEGSAINAGGVESRGIEAAASFSLTEELTFYTAYTYNDSTLTGTGNAALDAANSINSGNRVPSTAENLFVASLDWASGPYRAGVSSKYTGARFADRANSWQIEDYWLTDLYVGVSGDAISDSLRGLDASIVVNNVTDEDYLGGISGGGAWIGAPRTVVFTLTADF